MSLPEGFAAACVDLIGAPNVIADPAEQEPYTVDFWRLIRGRAALVLRPGTTAEVAGIVRLAAEAGVPLVPQAGNTGLVGGGVPDASGTQVLLSLARLDPDGGVHVGPESSGAEPGPVCYGRGGEEPTVTDGNVVVGVKPA